VKFARGTPWGFIALNGLGSAAVVAIGLYVVVWLRPQGAVPFPRLPTDLLMLALTVLSIEWFNLLLFFFRDPERTVGAGVVAPCDGKVRAAAQEGPTATVSVFLRPSDVHVVRAPIAGRLTSLEHKAGGKRFAFSKDSALNERLVLTIAGDGASCTLTLIAGAFADRIFPYVAPGAALVKGERLGIIKFGSRVDLEYESAGVAALLVKPGGTVIAGVTPILGPAQGAASP
jgi:phosphatidylserine decarboxylase